MSIYTQDQEQQLRQAEADIAQLEQERDHTRRNLRLLTAALIDKLKYYNDLLNQSKPNESWQNQEHPKK